jgi:hypothetical protein
MTAEELTGKLIMVHPQLYDDPAAKTGEIGSITAADLREDLFRVRFDDDKRGLYAANALLTFKPVEQIYEHLKKEVMKLQPAVFGDLKKIALLLDYGMPAQQRTAMAIAQRNPDVVSAAFVTLEDSLGLGQQHEWGR